VKSLHSIQLKIIHLQEKIQRGDEEMKLEDKKLIAEYMGWKMPCNAYDANVGSCAIEGQLCIHCEFYHPLNANDAALCVKEMVKRGEWKDFEAGTSYVYWVNNKCDCLCDAHDMYIAWLFNADNFFSALAEWLRVRK